jgi:alpha-L-fucosidase
MRLGPILANGGSASGPRTVILAVGLVCLAACSQNSSPPPSGSAGGRASGGAGGSPGNSGGATSAGDTGGATSAGNAGGATSAAGAGGATSAGNGGRGGATNIGGGGTSTGGGGQGRGGDQAAGGAGTRGGGGTGQPRGGASGSSAGQQGGTSDAGARGGSGGAGGADAGGFATPFTPTPVGGASKVSDPAASGGSSVGLGGNGQGAEATGLPAASRLAIHYATVSTGTISVSVNGGTARKVNVHATGALTGSFLYSIIDVDIPASAKVTISKASDDVAVNIDKLIVGDGSLGLPPDMWNLSPFKAADGPYKADWTALGLTYQAPQWWRDAKLGGWAHWDPQSMPEHGDWYAYDMYIPGKDSYNFHQSHFGDPSVYGYKDICKNWVIDKWDPSSLMDVYVQMGAKFFMSMGSHHDNFDNFDSTYQPWNSVKIGVKQDIVGTWAQAARQKGLRFGVGFHNSPARTWGQWMPVRYTSGSKGPYDAMLTILDGKGKWWEGLDPADLYGYQHKTDCANQSCNNSPYGTQLQYRVDDAIQKYHPDVVYFDDHAGGAQSDVDLGIRMGFGSIATTILANYYNKSLAWNDGKMEVVMNMKGVSSESFGSDTTAISQAERSLVRSSEAKTESTIGAYPFQTEYNIQGVYWHIMAGAGYTSAASLVTTLMQNVSRNGSLMLNLTQRGRGNFDDSLVQIAKDIGSWLKVNGEAVYASRPFEVWGDDSVIYTRSNGNVYATLLNWNGGAVNLSALKSGGATLGTVSKVELLGSTVAMTFSQSGTGLTVTPSGSVTALSGLSDQQLASKIRVLRITHDKGWFNDDDSGAVYAGWLRKANLKTGDYNNDLTTSTTTGDTWTAPFTGTGVSVYAPKESGAGKIEIQVDGQVKDTVDLSASGARQPQQLVSAVTGLGAGQHTISIINRGPGPVAVDAIVVK